MNVDQAAHWDGPDGDHWTEYEARYDTAGRHIWNHFLEAVRIDTDDEVLDFGCGTGKSTRDAARRASSGSALGVDLSARMLERARERSREQGLHNVRFEQADAQVHPFDESSVDIAISCFGAMFFSDPIAAFTNIGRALRPGGRLALLTWRDPDSNEWVQAFRHALAMGRDLPVPSPGAPGPFGLAEPERVRGILADAGFDDVELDQVDEPLEYGGDADDAFGFVSKNGMVVGLTEHLDEPTRQRAFDNIRDMLAAHQTNEGVRLGTSSWLITARRP
ncbi:MAG: methyltransferase domain-containing protein [Actinomycetota bacterium]|nr:methyltransferase domain-containing protein [Actinomycetota bacterium]